MGRRHFKPEQIIHRLREAEIKPAGGRTTGEVCHQLGISEQSYYPWRKEYGRIGVPDQEAKGPGAREYPAEEAGRRTGFGQGYSRGSPEGKILSPERRQ